MSSLNQLNKPAPKNGINIYLSLLVVLSSCYGILNSLTQVAQYTPAIISAFIAIFLLLTRKNIRVHKIYAQSTLCGAFITVSALLGAAVSQDIQSSLYSLVFFATWLSIILILQNYSMPTILRSFAYGGTAAVLVYLAASGFKIEGALSISGSEFTTHDRATGPYISQPNLIAHNMAIFAILAILLAPSEKKTGKVVLYSTAIIAILILLSTASRGGLVALVAALLITTISTYRGNYKFLLIIASSIIVLGLYFVLFQVEYVDRLVAIMDLNSSQRGLDSGFSGRQDLWMSVFSQFFTVNIPFLWGGGFRNEWLSSFVKAVDNGYIVVIAETGFISLIIIIARLIFVMMRSYKRMKYTPNTMDSAIVGLISFILIESIVARYLLAIGNPASFLILFFIVAGAKGYFIDHKTRN